jgi:hypothetical protein
VSISPTIKYMPFKQMKATIAHLQATILPVLATLKADTLSREQTLLVTTILIAKDKTAQTLKNNPTRLQLLKLCGAWHRFAVQLQPLVPVEMAQTFQNALDSVAWIKELETVLVSEVRN